VFQEVAQVCLRISKILFFGQVFLCGLETPVLKLQKSETGVSEYVSVVEASSTSSPSSPPTQVRKVLELLRENAHSRIPESGGERENRSIAMRVSAARRGERDPSDPLNPIRSLSRE